MLHTVSQRRKVLSEAVVEVMFSSWKRSNGGACEEALNFLKSEPRLGYGDESL